MRHGREREREKNPCTHKAHEEQQRDTAYARTYVRIVKSARHNAHYLVKKKKKKKMRAKRKSGRTKDTPLRNQEMLCCGCALE